jgi:RIO-like serine/threonine protein kinase
METYTKYNVSEKEYQMHKIMAECGVAPIIISYDGSTMITKDAGKILSHTTNPRNYEKQLKEKVRIMHDKGIFHMDLSELNIVVDDEDNAWIIDFGESIWHREFTPELALQWYDADVNNIEDMKKCKLDEINYLMNEL